MLKALHRIAAGAAVAASTGAMVGFGIVALGVADRDLSGRDAYVALMQAPLVSAVFGLIIGGIPAAVVMLLSRARHAPWRAVPVLLAGTTIGIVLVIALGMLFPSVVAASGLLLLVAGATLGGVVASRRVPIR